MILKTKLDLFSYSSYLILKNIACTKFTVNIYFIKEKALPSDMFKCLMVVP